MRLRMIFLFILLLALVGCATATPSIESGETESDQPVATVYPYPVPAQETSIPGYPPPVEETAAPTPTTDPTLGMVKGELYLKGKPVGETLLFLSDVIKDQAGNDSVVSVDYTTKNRAITNQDGSFTFVNVPPNHYALVLVIMPHTFVLLEPKTQAAMVIDVRSGDTVSTGRLDYDDLPIP